MLEWYVFNHDCNKKEITTVNIFDRFGTARELKDILKKETKEEFADEVKSTLMYHFWSRCEYEIIITAWPPNPDVELKTDYFQQIWMNWDRFIDYFWENKNELKALIKARQR